MTTNQKPETIYLKDYQVPAFLIERIDLDVKLDPTQTKIASRLIVRRNPDHPDGSAPLVLDGENIELEEIAIDGKTLPEDQYQLEDNKLTISSMPVLSENAPKKPLPEHFSVITLSTCNPQDNKALSGLYRSSDIYCTQCEPEGFRRITWFIDRPDVLSIFRIRLEAKKASVPILLANGNLVDSGDLPEGRHFALWEDPFKKPSYLFAMVGGALGVVKDSFVTMSGRKVDLHIYVEPGKEDRCSWAMDCLKRSMSWDEERFGREYDLDLFMIVAVSDFNMGAMENKGLNIFNDKLILARPDTATDADYANIERVIAHEYFHNWTGNRITCRDWFQLCLKEGLTVFRDQEFSADERDRTVQRIMDVRHLQSFQFPEDGGPLAHPVRPDHFIEINNFYTSTVYEKGAELVRMIETMLGRDRFRKGLDQYFDRHDGEAATVEQFIKCFEDVAEIDLSQFMAWYAQAGTPELACSLDHNPKEQTATLSVTQLLPPTPGQDHKKAQLIPLKMGLLDKNGHDLPLTLKNGDDISNCVLQITQHEQSFEFTDITEKPVMSLLRGFSAPVNINTPMDNAELLFLMRHDNDLFNRWQAAQTCLRRLLIDNIEAQKSGNTAHKGADFIKALEHSITDEELPASFRAMLMAFPGESDIAREIGENVDPDAIHEVRMKMRASIGSVLSEPLLKLYNDSLCEGPYNPDAKSAGLRSLRHAALGLLNAIGEPQDIKRLYQHYIDADNMTEKATALEQLAQTDTPERQKAFAEFYETWKSDHLVIDKWFAFQAMSAQNDTLDRIEELMRDELFSLKNPNKVRSVIGAFSMANPVQFNRADGRGYEFMARNIIEIDGFNPQIASRLTGAFKSWKILEPIRREKLKAILDDLAGRDNLSPDTYEIITKVIQ